MSYSENPEEDALLPDDVLPTINMFVQRQRHAELIRIKDDFENYFLYYPERIAVIWIDNASEGLGSKRERLADINVGYETVSIRVSKLLWKDVDILNSWKRKAMRVQLIAVAKPTDVDAENLIKNEVRNKFAYFYYRCLETGTQITSFDE